MRRIDYSPTNPGPMRGIVIGTVAALPLWAAIVLAVLGLGRGCGA